MAEMNLFEQDAIAPLLTETEEVAMESLSKGGYEALYQSDYTSTFPLNVFKVLREKKFYLFSLLMSCLKNKGTLNKDNNNQNLSKTCLISSDKKYFVNRICLIDDQYKTIKSEDERKKWSSGDDALEYEGHKYHFYLSYEAHDKKGSSDLRINDFAMTLYTITNGDCFISFSKTESSVTRYTMTLYSKIQFAFFKLGKAAVQECLLLDSQRPGLVEGLLTVKLSLTNSAFPKEWAKDNYVFLWLGSDNNMGTPTSWKQGIKAIAKSLSEPYKNGSETCVDTKVLYVFPEAINILSLLKYAPVAYYWCSSMPFINPMDHANQSARLVRDIELSDPKAFFYALNVIDNNFSKEILKKEPELEQFFDYKPESPVTAGCSNSYKVIKEPLQQIFYGAPGTGKSNRTNEITSCYPDTVRTTFHPDSDYSTFVGAYKPTSIKEDKLGLNGSNTVSFKDAKGNDLKESKIEYRFIKQAFLKAYVRAWKKFALFKPGINADEQGPTPQFLVIEEINRGNCAQIFGDLFQLLDRKSNFSEYPIEADDDIRKALLEDDSAENLSFGPEGLTLDNDKKSYINSLYSGNPVADKICKGQQLVLPPNLYIWATMNTSVSFTEYG